MCQWQHNWLITSIDQQINEFFQMITSTVLITNVWKTPYVAQIDGKSNNSQQEFCLLVPGFALPFRMYGHNC